MSTTKSEIATRLAPRTGSFADFDQDGPQEENDKEFSSSDSAKAALGKKDVAHLLGEAINTISAKDPAMLFSENEQLRQQIKDLRSEVKLLRHHYQQQQQESRRKSYDSATPEKSVILELPRAMKGGVQLNCLRKKTLAKDHQSSCTDDDQSTIEVSRDWDIRESMPGLKQRHYQNQSAGRKIHLEDAADGVVKTAPSPLENEDSLSSDGMEGQDEEEGWVTQETEQLIRRSAALETPVSEEESFWSSVSDRAGWLVGLLILQSMSSFILGRNEKLLQNHSVIVRFLTMLVGAGGNAGNQASVRVIRGLAVGTIDASNQNRFLKREFLMGAALSLILGTAGCIRAAVFLTPFMETLAITTSLFMIVIISVALGALLPLGLKMIGIDPAHSSTTIQVVMDILGVSITVWMSSLVLDSNFFQSWFFTAFTDAR